MQKVDADRLVVVSNHFEQKCEFVTLICWYVLADSDQLGHSEASQELDESGVLPGPDAAAGDQSVLSEGTVTDMLLGPTTPIEQSPEYEVLPTLPLAEITASMLDTEDSDPEPGALVIVEEESDVSREL